VRYKQVPKHSWNEFSSYFWAERSKSQVKSSQVKSTEEGYVLCVLRVVPGSD